LTYTNKQCYNRMAFDGMGTELFGTKYHPKG